MKTESRSSNCNQRFIMFPYLFMQTFLNPSSISGDIVYRSKICFKFGSVCFVCFGSLRSINNLSVKKGCVFLGWTSTKLGLMFLLKDATPVRLEPAAPRSQVKHSTTEPLHSLGSVCAKVTLKIGSRSLKSNQLFILHHCYILANLAKSTSTILTHNAPIATKVICFSRLLKCLRSL